MALTPVRSGVRRHRRSRLPRRGHRPNWTVAAGWPAHATRRPAGWPGPDPAARPRRARAAGRGSRPGGRSVDRAANTPRRGTHAHASADEADQLSRRGAIRPAGPALGMRNLLGGTLWTVGKPNQVPVSCAVCSASFFVKASRARQNNAITCSHECLSTLRSRNQIAFRGSSASRVARCAHCGGGVVRKPSQLAKYKRNYCNRACHRAAKLGIPHLMRRTGQWIPCGTCGRATWRTPATQQPNTFCSRLCAGRVGQRRTTRVTREPRPCPGCGTVRLLLPWMVKRGRRGYCSFRCAAQVIQGAKRGLPGKPWTEPQRARVVATLRRKYANEWATKRGEQSRRMRGSGNPQWRDGRARSAYAPGFTDVLKRRIADRDGHRCRICGARRGKGTHAVHHIDGGKWNHDESNLVLLCHRCHQLVHHREAQRSGARPR